MAQAAPVSAIPGACRGRPHLRHLSAPYEPARPDLHQDWHSRSGGHRPPELRLHGIRSPGSDHSTGTPGFDAFLGTFGKGLRMRHDDLRRLLRREPCPRLRLHLSGGVTFEITDPDLVVL